MEEQSNQYQVSGKKQKKVAALLLQTSSISEAKRMKDSLKSGNPWNPKRQALVLSFAFTAPSPLGSFEETKQ